MGTDGHGPARFFRGRRDLFEESRESFDASMYDGREFLFAGRTIPVKNCSRNGGCNPAIFILFSFVFNASPCASVRRCTYVNDVSVCLFFLFFFFLFFLFFLFFFGGDSIERNMLIH